MLSDSPMQHQPVTMRLGMFHPELPVFRSASVPVWQNMKRLGYFGAEWLLRSVRRFVGAQPQPWLWRLLLSARNDLKRRFPRAIRFHKSSGYKAPRWGVRGRHGNGCLPGAFQSNALNGQAKRKIDPGIGEVPPS